MRVLLVDDHTPTREHVKTLLSQEQDLNVVAAVGSAEEALEMARLHRPDVVVMDLMLPGMNGVDATRLLLGEMAETRIMVLSNHSSPALVRAVLEAGGLGYVRKNRACDELIPAIRVVGAGRQYIGTA